MKSRDSIGTRRRFLILRRDSFTCAFCGARPGNDRLHVDHLIPHSLGGSDHANNLMTACDRCNIGKRARLLIPASICLADEPLRNGWRTWMRWGEWHLMFLDDLDDPDDVGNLVLTFQPERRDYYIDFDRFHEPDWHEHLEWKPFMQDDFEETEAREQEARDRRSAAPPPLGWQDAVDMLSVPAALALGPGVRARGRRWADFCEGISFARTLVRRGEA